MYADKNIRDLLIRASACTQAVFHDYSSGPLKIPSGLVESIETDEQGTIFMEIDRSRVCDLLPGRTFPAALHFFTLDNATRILVTGKAILLAKGASARLGTLNGPKVLVKIKILSASLQEAAADSVAGFVRKILQKLSGFFRHRPGWKQQRQVA